MSVQNKILYLAFLIAAMSAVFTGVIVFLFNINLLLGVIAAFLIIATITVRFLREIIEQKFDLLLRLPKQGQTVNPFQLKVFDKLFWRYPEEGSFVFNSPQETKETSPILLNLPLVRENE